ncbi:alcohol dehydrogenase, zinc-binding [Luminiphilus syltensis NOR5-1B]|uniref:Alcohol dehydrogenase, zinc-binding n=1 Tax=Luminiphilus syltensis NOR5-1B TaxID=565045 RepID=B8KY31_9GAMM|nr:zinc-binding dehydrogenase [Luminiphilus syltensis]EED34980.1 alcohol dehydrogenase, zinc-binding [Luminiphilus syltensis NOR5-1B]
MKATLTVAHGDRSMLQFRDDHPTPTAGTGQVVVNVAACAVNFHDVFTRRGMPGITLDLPVVVGSDIAGTVASVGSDVDQSWVGKRVLVDPVYFHDGKPHMIGETVDGGRAEQVAVPAENLIELPDSVSFEAAASLPLAYGTAWRMMVTIGNVTEGEKVLVLGASGGVGAACVQIAKLRGCEVLACASSEQKLQRLRDIGADHVHNYVETPFLDGVKSVYGKPRLDGSGGVTVAVNFTGGDTMPATQRCVSLGGRILTCGATAGYDLQVDARYWWSYEHKMLGSDGWKRSDLEALVALIAEGRLDPVVDVELPISEAAEAERMIEDREVFGKILLKP